MNRIIKAGIDAIAHLIINETMDPKGISKSIILTCPITGWGFEIGLCDSGVVIRLGCD
jgi:hypothetical protein